MRYFNKLTAFIIFLIISSCQKLVEVSPPETALVSTTVFEDDVTAKAAITATYSKMMESSNLFVSGSQSISLLTSLSADELQNYSTVANQAEFYTNALTISNNYVLSLWSELYQYIYYINAAIEGLTNSSGITNAVKNQLKGEALFIRAFCYFYLANLYGNVPLITTTDYQQNAIASRTLKAQVYQQIISDLKEAQILLHSDYSYSNGERIRPNKWAATALLARVYLYTNDWINAEAKATDIINNLVLYNLETDPSNVFLKNSAEAIWQLSPVIPGFNTFDAPNFILLGAPFVGTTRSVSLSSKLINAFETGDKRKESWIASIPASGITYYYPYKYKVTIVPTGSSPSEYLIVLRLAEQYLIRAEARAQQNNIIGAQSDLNIIRSRAGLPSTLANTQTTLLSAIEYERGVELFTEFGHRWMDLKRTNRSDVVLLPIKRSNWQTTDQLYPIPQSEIQKNPRLLPQNSGY